MTFRFNKEEHAYYMGDRRIASVNQILERVGMKHSIYQNEENTLKYMKLGTEFHRLTEEFDLGRIELDDTSIDYRLRPKLVQWAEFRECWDCEVLALEERFVFDDGSYSYAGTADRVVIRDGKECILEIKSSFDPKHVRLQVAGYAYGIGCDDVVSVGYKTMDSPRYVVEVNRERWRLRTFTGSEDIETWKHALKLYDYLEER